MAPRNALSFEVLDDVDFGVPVRKVAGSTGSDLQRNMAKLCFRQCESKANRKRWNSDKVSSVQGPKTQDAEAVASLLSKSQPSISKIVSRSTVAQSQSQPESARAASSVRRFKRLSQI
ncbi:hypothetical protein GUITHDRAFT_102585 [Guillardia theta CCMP2712]|uniref:Uncharacterized protein n=2 Tax=Guillardia theta TaxID=55529 RepID=L1JV57_GUITC|nr:hypothetical protein GUITHDRAFT_102585 [Guillardia theta CCMP2712]EKX51973.1 hypothetical protein GUITHDRAFT_102585 [Guillardia theta CCMP2712]|mmetsp:Transcript_22507/g.73843  ORF Transcript_22507/g.73843 Transcript_22507/m.73843 type:complete len:118 (+) Transcript_22507:801-1154(+)|eukprot:XP_005838953.1 hypothetical protein GUITHDRAFT_102585 [Guillardia theta CCMP2712]